MLLFYFHFSGILRSEGDLDQDTWRFLLTDGLGGGQGEASPSDDHAQPNPDPDWLSDKAWNQIVRASVQLPYCQVEL